LFVGAARYFIGIAAGALTGGVSLAIEVSLTIEVGAASDAVAGMIYDTLAEARKPTWGIT
jgi:hypothetical protein